MTLYKKIETGIVLSNCFVRNDILMGLFNCHSDGVTTAEEMMADDVEQTILLGQDDSGTFRNQSGGESDDMILTV